MGDQFGQFVWFELHTDDVTKSKKYYTELLDWKETEMDMGGEQKYLMLESAAGKPQMGIIESQMKGAPPHFAQYLSVEDVDQTADTAQKAGGKILVPATDIPVGRFAVIADPQGASLALFKGKGNDTESAGDFHWNELWSPDSPAVAGFYEQVFGLKSEKMEMPGLKDPYLIFKKGEEMMGGAMTSPMKGVPAMWLPYIRVPDIDATLARAKARGGEQLAPTQEQPGIGRFAVVKEPAGAVLGLITPTAK